MPLIPESFHHERDIKKNSAENTSVMAVTPQSVVTEGKDKQGGGHEGHPGARDTVPLMEAEWASSHTT